MLLANRSGCCSRLRAGLPAAQAARPTYSSRGIFRHRHGLHVCHTAASDEKQRRSQPMFLSDLIAFESDTEDDEPSPEGSNGSSSKSGSSLDAGSSLAGTLGLAGTEADPTHRAQEIINRATEVLAAARAALGPTDGSSSSGAATGISTAAPSAPGRAPTAPSSSSRSGTPTPSGNLSSPAPAAQQRQAPPPSSSGPAAAPPAASSPAGAAAGPSSAGISNGPNAAAASGSATEPLTRRWSQLSDGQDLTRHVLQNALDQMQRSGAPIAAPKDTSSSSSSSAGPGAGAAAGTGPAGARPAGASAAGAAGGGVKLSRDLRSSSSSSSSTMGGAGGAAGSAAADAGHTPAPSWAQSLLGADDFGGSGGLSPGYLFPPEPPIPQMQSQAVATALPSALAFADDAPAITLPPAALGLVSQSVLDAERAKSAVLPPLQSVMELTTAFRPPERNGAAPAAAAVAVDAVSGEAVAAPAPVGRALADGSGRLADGTWWEKKSGIEYGKNGYWKKWQLLKGGSADGTLQWEELWWEASDYTGLKEMGAEKKGNNAEGDAWRESWSERLMYASNDLDCVVERNAHKWAAEANGDEWEEKWGEHYHASGKVAKFADKWGKTGPNVWHERWGEDYDASLGDACVKWTDKWAERLLPDGAREQWGDKWREAFANGRGEKTGEVWSVGAGGDRYQRWWGEQHLGDMRVRRHGHSTTGEQWDDIAHMDTYYNPVPHFGFKLALAHSPQLRNVPLKPKPVNEKDPFGPGLDQL